VGRLRLILTGLALCGLAACDVPLPGQGVQTLALLDGAVKVRAPQGYCVDPVASRAETGFAVISSCGLIAATGVFSTTDGFVTVQFGPEGSAAVTGSEDALAALLRTRQGAALLSQSGQPNNIRVDHMDRGDGLISVHFTDRGPALVDGLMQDEWRAFLDINGRLTTISVRAYERTTLTSGQAQELLYATVAQVRAANARAATASEND
jgi:hypothetical protein